MKGFRSISKTALVLFGIISLFSIALYAEARADPQSRLMARKAARVDALRNLAEMVYGVSLTSDTTVANFVTQSDVIRTRLDAVIQGAGEVNYSEGPDGTAEVTVAISVQQVVEALGIPFAYDSPTISATGYGAQSGAYAPPVPEAPAVPPADIVTAKGYGAEPGDRAMSPAQRSLMAKRAAKLDALRNLAEEVKGVKITSDTYVRDFVTQSDEVNARLQAFIRGARVVSETRMPDGTYECEVAVDRGALVGLFER